MNIKESDKPATPDIIWKMFIRKFFQEFLKAFKPDLLKDILVDKTEFLEKELLTITGKQKKGIVDFLAKVYLKNGSEQFVLFHIEIQGYSDREFSERMYGYYIRIWDKYRKMIVSLALLTDNPKKRVVSNIYKLEGYGTKQIYEYNLVDISKMEYDILLQSDNPVDVGISILVNDKKTPKSLKKINALERLKYLGLDQEGINILLAFIDRVLKLNPKELEKFEEYKIKASKEVNMILTSWEEKGLKKGRQEGRQEGKQEGRQEGRQEGKQEEKLEIARNMLKEGFDIEKIQKITGLKKNVLTTIKAKKVGKRITA